MSPSRALLDGVLKYKRLHRDRERRARTISSTTTRPRSLEFCFGTADLAAKLGTR